MSKVDEHASVPGLDAGALRRLTRAMDRDGVVAASVIGSQATGTAGRLSDVDVGVWSDPSLTAQDRGALRLELTDAAVRALDTPEVDLVMLNDAAPLMRHRAMSEGRRILDRDPRQRVRLETRALLDYLDTAPLRATLATARRRRIADGSFGRR